ncbi:hypothetical protein Sango_3041500 [Sesamum angolense]|uniref:Uncharacterized protein n=1 Tax=Sesamum angolense TaxID=2727404 RepID=A0AAE1T9P8_9LAMI|nr:hypothetical protein Sango_3041500 [Sesamum angolense]
MARLVNIKAEHNMYERCYDQVSQNGCMLYWKDNTDMEFCKFCGDPRYKPIRDPNPRHKKFLCVVLMYLPLTPRLRRLYTSPAPAEHMTWHANHVTEEDSMCHPSDAEAWRHFDRTHPDFALEPHNIRLGLCIDRFALHGQYGRTYSCWPVIITPYNLPPGMCMKFEYMFLTMVIPGVGTHDHAANQTFIMRATLMWVVNDLPAYGMSSGWCIAGIMGCLFVWMTQAHFICNTIGRRATLTATNSFSQKIIHTRETRKPS